ncbi:hypothetical protein ACOME3_000722 [Neoechinorhynchus agilis]
MIDNQSIRDRRKDSILVTKELIFEVVDEVLHEKTQIFDKYITQGWITEIISRMLFRIKQSPESDLEDTYFIVCSIFERNVETLTNYDFRSDFIGDPEKDDVICIKYSNDSLVSFILVYVFKK